MKVTLDKETFSRALSQELLPLAQKCWNERTLEKGETCAFHGARDIAIEPDMESYQRLANQGSVVLVTVRDAGVLKGYVLGLIHQSMHLKSVRCGFVDCIYLEPEYRSYTGPVAERFEREMKNSGVEIIGWPVHINGPIYAVAKAMGYIGDDCVMEKRLNGSA